MQQKTMVLSASAHLHKSSKTAENNPNKGV